MRRTYWTIFPKEGDTFVDIGAAFGFYTIVGSRKVGRQEGSIDRTPSG